MKIKETLQSMDFNIDIDWQNDCVNVRKKNGAYNFDFLVGYEISHCGSYYLSDNAETGNYNTNVEIQDVTELGVYDMHDNFIELQDSEIEELSDIILKKLHDNNYNR